MARACLPLASLALSLLLALSVPASAALSQQFYVWNRSWSPAVRSAVSQFGDVAQGWRVLAAESDASGRLRRVAVDWVALAATHRPITAVIRIDGQLSLNNERHSPEGIAALARSWPATVTGLEIDHDCGVARLPDYGRFLEDLKKRIAPRRLSVTALPAWLGTPALDAILAATDEAVLQVHAVLTPGRGLFDPERARAWVAAFSRRDPKAFRIAVPDYGSRVIRDETGRLIAVESEMPRLVGGTSAEELLARPADVAQFLDKLSANPPPHLAGLAWFRLPVAGDARVWSPATLRSVMRGEAPQEKISVLLQPGAAGAVDVALQNDGETDALLPSVLLLPRDCRLADGVNGYALKQAGEKFSFVRLQNGILRAHHRRVVGWARCGGRAVIIQFRP